MPLLAAVLLALFPFLTGCEPAEAGDVQYYYDAINRAFDSADGQGAVALLARRSIEQYDHAVQMAKTGTREQIKNLPGVERGDILMMRHRLTPEELAPLDGRAWLILATDRGWMAHDPDEVRLELGRITVNGDTASAEIVVEGERTGAFYDFVREDGVWKLDWIRVDKLFNRWIAEGAAEAGMSEDEYLIMWEEQETGRPVRPDIWDRHR